MNQKNSISIMLCKNEQKGIIIKYVNYLQIHYLRCHLSIGDLKSMASQSPKR